MKSKQQNKDDHSDPTDYLWVSKEQKRQDQCKPYDAKRSCWVPHEKEGFILGEIKSAKADEVIVKVDYKELSFKRELVSQVNPPKFEKCEDMSDLTYLNDASVLWNLKARYFAKLIYTYSGLFCVAVNPYRRYPIYTERVVQIYRGKRRTEVPPHIFATADKAYVDMLTNHENQSLLITGESGAGKTENTKKVISYFANVGASDNKQDSQKYNLAEQVVQTNPVLEAFGNAKTVRNDNSSRFGKFIRIHFNGTGKLAGADIETYLLEKARVVSQQPNERSYHIFYQVMSNGIPGLRESLKLTDNIQDYPKQSMGTIEIPGIDDKEEMLLTDECMDILGFSEDEKTSTYKIVATVMILGNIEIMQFGRDEQAEVEDQSQGRLISKLIGIRTDDFFDNLLRPQIKVGGEYVTQGRNRRQVIYSIGALCKAIYDRLFTWIVFRCNNTLDTKQYKEQFIGVLDIAGFEIFDFNSFEQLCINFTNEKLQQFFNHHMFVLEQEEYQREGIQWTFIDFGLDLQACIDLIEKPLGIFSILEEESMFPKASDKTFEEKLKNNHLGKSPNFVRPKTSSKVSTSKPPPPKKVESNDDGEKIDLSPHFAIIHYAGTVAYNLTGWLEKNKDPLNDAVVEQFKKAKDPLAKELFKEHAGEFKQIKRTKGSAFQTVSALYREQVGNLMQTLRATEPHFIRCIIPNEHKEPGVIDSHLVMHQLTCNGVLEGIRICRKGFPNRMLYKEFKERYLILASREMTAMGYDNKAATKVCLEKIHLEEEKFRLGHTKVFFRSGVLGYLEELRDQKLAEAVTLMQAACRGYLGKRRIGLWMKRKKVITILQRAIRHMMAIRPWLWYKLFRAIRPLLKMGVHEDMIQELKEKLDAQQYAMDEEEKRIEDMEDELKAAEEERQKLLDEMAAKDKEMKEMRDREAKLKEEALRRQAELDEANKKLAYEEGSKSELEKLKRDSDDEIRRLKELLAKAEQNLIKAEQDKACKDKQLKALNEEILTQEESFSKLKKEKKALQQENQRLAEDLQAAEDKNHHLTNLKKKLEDSLADMEREFQKEKEARNKLEKAKRKAEEDLKSVMANLADQEKANRELMASNQKKEKELAILASKLEDEQAALSKMQRDLKARNTRIEELEEEMEAERQARARAEKKRQDMERELQDMRMKLEEAGGDSEAQKELNRKREAEMARMRAEMEEAAIKNEAALAAARKKQDEALAEMERRLQDHNRLKSQWAKDKQALEREANDAKQAADRALADKANLEREFKRNKQLLLDYEARLAEANRNVSDLDAFKQKMSKENSDLLRRLTEAENLAAMLNKAKNSLENQLKHTQERADAESKERSSLLAKYRNLERDYNSVKSSLDDEIEQKADLQRQLAKLNSELSMWKAKYETDALNKMDELDDAKTKLQLRLAEAQDTIEALNNRCANLEKLKQKLMMDMDDLQRQADDAIRYGSQMEKKVKNFDKIIDEWKRKVEELTRQLQESEKENRNLNSELFRVKAAYQAQTEEYDRAQKEIKNLSNELKDLLDQLGEDGRKFHELMRLKRRLEVEKDELAATLEEAEGALEVEENKVHRAQQELEQLKNEIDRRIMEKMEEFENTKKSMSQMISSLEASLEAELRGKADLLRTKKRLEADIQELEMCLDHSNRQNIELQKSLKRANAHILDLRQQLYEEQQNHKGTREALSVSERKSNALANEVEQLTTLLEQAERRRVQMEDELRDCQSLLQESNHKNSSLVALKRKLELEIIALKTELKELADALRNAEEKCKLAMMDAMKLSDELNVEKNKVAEHEATKRGLEMHIKELQARVDDLEGGSIKGGRKIIEKLQAKIVSLTADLDNEERIKVDACKGRRKAERKAKDFEFQLNEQHCNYERLQDLIAQLQNKIRTLKQQIEDAEEIAALNLAKYKKAQDDAEDAEKRANVAEFAMKRMRSKSCPRGSTIVQ